METRQNTRIVFSGSYRPHVKFKLISRTYPVEDIVYDASILDLSVSGAQLAGPLPDKHIYQLGLGNIQLGCNLILKENLVKTLAKLRWFRSTGLAEFQFGVQFENSDTTQQEIQKFLIRHQLDTRKLVRIKQ